MDLILILPLIVSFVSVIVFLPTWIKKMNIIGFTDKDMNKLKKPKISKSGGFIAIMGFLVGLFTYIAINTFYFKTNNSMILMLSLASVILLLTIIGFIDDLFEKKRGGLTRRIRILLFIFAAIPLIIINAGQSNVSIPFIGMVNLGLFYPLLIIPLGIVFGSSVYNSLAGYNGLEAGQGIIILSSFALICYFIGEPVLSLICLCMVFSLIGFYIFNKYPAKTFPGNSLTFVIGGLVAGISILGNFERIALFIFIPYIIEMFLKIRGRLKMQSFAKPTKKGLEMPYKKIYGLEHLAIKILKKFKKEVNEKDVVCLIFGFQVLIILIAFLVFKGNIFI